MPYAFYLQAKNTLKSIVLANGTVKHIALSSAAQFNVGKLAQTYPAVPGGQGILINAKVSPQSLIKVKVSFNVSYMQAESRGLLHQL